MMKALAATRQIVVVAEVGEVAAAIEQAELPDRASWPRPVGDVLALLNVGTLLCLVQAFHLLTQRAPEFALDAKQPQTADAATVEVAVADAGEHFISSHWPETGSCA